MLPYNKREEWLLEAILKERFADVLNVDFVDAYVEATGANVQIMMWGANRCRMLASDMSKMHKKGLLKKHRAGLGGNWQPGFPKWVNSYSLSRCGIARMEQLEN